MTTRSKMTVKTAWCNVAVSFMALAAVLLLGACGAAPPKPQSLTVTIEAAPTVNPDMQGRPSPIVVQVLELRSADQFSSLDYFSLSSDITAALSADLLNQQQMVIKPGDNRVIEMELNPQSTTLGFIAGYRDMDNAVWRQTVGISETVKSVTVKLDQQQLSAAASD